MRYRSLHKEISMEGVDTFTVTDARKGFADMVSRVAYSRKPAVITKNDKRAVAVVPYDMVELFSRLEALVDIGKAFEALEDFEKNGGVSWNDLKRELEIE